ncbi:ribokinase [Chromohalobacter canadensis]|uniref:Ribokinase n=1 Tax=Chromohalobacter canadensis TaxID=141389 RepID=A0ABZ0YBD3_9GAMM|nr:ribokinase [Chromohalobacter canadensis]MCK0768594.1 ribokinase [Chromohalobacter canadensis]WQH09099.1 ribokinase [Chromohalobacter canadensis]
MLYNYGSINIDYVYRVSHLVRPGETLSSQSFTQVLGGKGANQSLAMARAGGDVTHWGRVSQNDRWVLEILTQAGVNTSLIELTAEASGHAIIQVDDHAENAIILSPGANHGFSERHLDALMTSVSPDDWLLLQNECNALESVMTLAARHGMQIAFNPAPLGENVHALPLELCQILFLNRGEAAALAGLDEHAGVAELMDVLYQRLPEVELVLTLGRDGVRYQFGEQRLELPAFPVEAVDTTAAGDTFIGYFMAARQRNAPIETCLNEASTAAALCVQKSGAAPSIPLASEVAATSRDWPARDILRH